MTKPSFRLASMCLLLVALGAWGRLSIGVSVAAPTYDSNVTVSARIDRSTITVGDQVLLVLTVTYPDGATVALPKIIDDIPPFEILSVGQVQTLRKDSTVVVEAEYQVTSFIVGELGLPPIKISYVEPSGARGEAISSGLPVKVVSVLGSGDEAGIKDVKPPISISGDPIPYRQLATDIVGVLVLAFAVAMIAKRLSKRVTPVASGVMETSPEERARQELGRIEVLHLNNGAASYTAFYSSIAECVRRYLAEKYGPWTLGCTTKELRDKMENSGLERWQARVVYGLLDECDSVRWARYNPAKARAERAIELAYEIVGAE
ncbi:MAG: hypothetical protein EXR50_05465 [Dehalococcoidia bacterium]|nr:hypothetical protein [Dehalococcoidia bacterium]